MPMPGQESPDIADTLFQPIPPMVHLSLIVVGMVGGYMYAQRTEDENVMRWVIIGGACGMVPLMMPRLYKFLKGVLTIAALALAGYYVAYLPLTHQRPDLRRIVDPVWRYLWSFFR